MKPILAPTLTLALLALPLLAEEAKKSETAKPKAAQTPAAAAQPAQPDSPLVAAAKRANRLGKKPASKVITNETLKSSGTNAHVTTTQQQTAIATAQQPSQETFGVQKTDEQRKAAEKAAEAKQKAAEQHTEKIRSAAERNEEAYPDDTDPAQAEKQMRDAYGEPAKDQKPPR